MRSQPTQDPIHVRDCRRDLCAPWVVDVLQFLASIVESLAWPLTVVAIVIVLRKPLASLLAGPVKSLKVGPTGVELETWDQAAAEVRTEVGTPPRPGESIPIRITEAGPPLEPEPAVSLREEFELLAESTPNAAVIEAFIRVESQLRASVGRLVANAPINLGGRALARFALDQGVINDATFNAFDGLSVMRNLAAHDGDDLDSGRALEFLDLADAVLYTIRHQRPG